MALQSSGQIKLSEIATELGASQTNISLASLSDTAGFSAPDAMTDFYGYASYSNSHYYGYDGTAIGWWGTASSPMTLNTTQDHSWNFWVRMDMTTKKNVVFYDINALDSVNTNDRFFIQYTANVNRIVVRMRTNSTNYGVQIPLHDNSSVTGISNSTTGWCSSQRGNTNSDGWTMITVTWDASAYANPATAIKVYWNGTQISSGAVTNTGAITSKSLYYACIGNNSQVRTSPTTNGTMNGGIDEVKWYYDVLTPSEVTTLWNSGVITDSSQTHSAQLVTEWTWDDGVNASNFTTTTNTGTRTAY